MAKSGKEFAFIIKRAAKAGFYSRNVYIYLSLEKELGKMRSPERSG